MSRVYTSLGEPLSQISHNMFMKSTKGRPEKNVTCPLGAKQTEGEVLHFRLHYAETRWHSAAPYQDSLKSRSLKR